MLTTTCSQFTKIFLELIKNQQEFNDRGIISFFPINTTMSINTPEQKEVDKLILEQERQVYKAIRLFSRKDYLDSITVCSSFVENINEFMRCLEIVTAGKCFTGPYNAIIENDKFEGMFPLRFNMEKGGNMYEWICAYIEQSLLNYYLNNERIIKEQSFEEYEQLGLLWRDLEHQERIAVSINKLR